jgi:exonuclease III
MDNPLHLALWNSNGLTQHAEELRTFISDHNIDVMLISETHFTDKNYFKLPFYSVYHTNQPAGTTHGGSAIIIKNYPA